MKILILGSKGQLGKCLKEQLTNAEINATFFCRNELDIVDFDKAREVIQKVSPNVIINATAYTAVDKAENNIEDANLVNHEAIANIASISKAINCWLIHLSTDYVFDGLSNIPYKEHNITNPKNIYGISKLNGEKAIKHSGCNYIIIRTSWVFSEHGNNFLKTMINLGKKLNELNIVSDQIGCPTYAQDLAKSIIQIVHKLNSNHIKPGIFNYCGDKPCSWYEFGQFIFLELEKFKFTIPNIVNPIHTKDFKTQAYRPPYSVLDCSKIKDFFDITPSDWQSGVTEAIKNYSKCR